MDERIKQLYESLHINQQTFAEFLGVSPATISSIIKHKSKPSLKIIEAIRKRYPNISLDWLMFGNGPMFLDEKSNDSASAPAPSTSEQNEPVLDFSDDSDSEVSAPSPTPFSKSVISTPKNTEKIVTKYVDKPQRHIAQIMVIYDDQTLETFVPKK